MKKVLALTVMIALLLSALPMAFAEDSVTEYVSGAITASELPTEVLSEPVSEAEIPTEIPTETPTELPTELPTETPTEEETDPVPIVSPGWFNLYIDSALAQTEHRTMEIDYSCIYVPAVEVASRLGIYCTMTKVGPHDSLCLAYEDKSGYFFKDNHFAIINHTALNMKNPCYVIDGVYYLPLYLLSDLFGFEYKIDRSSPDPDIYLKSLLSPLHKEYSDYVNGAGLTSKTDYLIWVSKANYSVRLFKRVGSSWQFEREFPCAIGASSTPTCEGTYKYYEKVNAWRYSTYYVGPVMRFNGGYALHSTLVNYDGTYRDDRVGVKISHGCVRLHPADINYLVNTVPLYTTVHVTAK